MAQFFVDSTRLHKQVKRSATLRYLMWMFEALALTVFWRVSALLPLNRASDAGRRLLKALGPRLPKSRNFETNRALAFPDRTETEIRTLVRETWGNVGALLAEYPHLESLSNGEAGHRIETVVKGHIRALHESGKPAIFVSAHLANWEILPLVGKQLGIPLTVVYTPLRNPWLDRMLQRKRHTLDCSFVSRDGGMREIMRILSNGGSIGLLVDQRVDTGELVPFFGLGKATTLVPARLAGRFDCELIPVRVERLLGARFRATLHDPIRPDTEAADEHERALQITRKMNSLFETWIREQPQEWLCSNRIWPKSTMPSPGG